MDVVRESFNQPKEMITKESQNRLAKNEPLIYDTFDRSKRKIYLGIVEYLFCQHLKTNDSPNFYGSLEQYKTASDEML